MEKTDLRINVGLDVVIKNDTPGKEKRITSKILGWEKDKIIIVKLSKDTDYKHYSVGTPLIVGFPR